MPISRGNYRQYKEVRELFATANIDAENYPSIYTTSPRNSLYNLQFDLYTHNVTFIEINADGEVEFSVTPIVIADSLAHRSTVFLSEGYKVVEFGEGAGPYVLTNDAVLVGRIERAGYGLRDFNSIRFAAADLLHESAAVASETSGPKAIYSDSSRLLSPSFSLLKGVYMVTVTGSSALDEAEFYVTIDGGEGRLEPKDISVNEATVTFSFELLSPNEAVQLVIANKSSDAVKIKEIVLKKWE
jgi:hypothetical protein